VCNLFQTHPDHFTFEVGFAFPVNHCSV
jgi:hypothetical protein